MNAGTAPSFHRRCEGGVELFVRLTPKSTRDEIEGVETAADGRRHLKARVRAVPEKGKANKALTRLIAAALHVPAGAVEIASGGTARLKTLHVAGNADVLEAKLNALATISGSR